MVFETQNSCQANEAWQVPWEPWERHAPATAQLRIDRSRVYSLEQPPAVGTHGQRLACHGLARSTKSSRKTRCASSMQIRAQQPMLAPRYATLRRGTAGSFSALLSYLMLSSRWRLMHHVWGALMMYRADEQDAGHGWGPIWLAFEATHHLPGWRGEGSLLLIVVLTESELSTQMHAMRVVIR